MTEKGSDELLAELGDMHEVMAPVIADNIELAEEERRVVAVAPADDEPGEDHPTPDETPPLDDAPDYDPLPPTLDGDDDTHDG